MPLADYQISYRGQTWGASTQVDLVKLAGLFDTTARISDRDFPRSHGGVAGMHLLGMKTFILEMEIREAIGSAALATLIEDTRGALLTEIDPDDDLDKMVLQMEGNEPELFIRARPIAVNMPRMHDTEFGIIPIKVQFKATDPRFYSTTLVDPGVQTGTFNVTNNGNITAAPIITANPDPSGDFVLTHNGTGVVITHSGETNDTIYDMDRLVRGNGELAVHDAITPTIDRYINWNTARVPFLLLPGTNSITLNTGGNVIIKHRDTYI